MDQKPGMDEEKNDGVVPVSVTALDTAAGVAAGEGYLLDPQEALRVRKKIDWHILPLMCILYSVQSMDRATLGTAAIMGIREDNHLTTNQYNWLGTIFYISYLAFEFPQNLCLQRFPVAKWLSLNIIIWAIALCSHAACKNFAGLLVARFVLGMCEGSITAGFLIVTTMFYTRTEQTLRVGYWFLMNGVAAIITGFLGFGVLHIESESFQPWRWLMIITGILTFLTGIAFWFFFPDSPTSAWFLTPAERTIAIMRIKENQTGVENKTFKKEQMIEAFCDPKTWLFALFAVLKNVPGSITYQENIIIASFGFTRLQTTLLSCIDGVVNIASIYSGVNIVARIPDSRAYVGFLYFIPNILGVFLINLLPWGDRVGLLFSLWITGLAATGFVLSLSWLSSVTAGHTKRVTTNTIMLSAYCIGNAAGPFMWQAKYLPRNHIPWIITGICNAGCMALLLIIRAILARDNASRDREPRDETYYDIYTEREGSDGELELVKVNKEFLDLTDRQNRDFRYVL